MNKYSFALFKEIQALYEEENEFSGETKPSINSSIDNPLTLDPTILILQDTECIIRIFLI